MKRTPYLLILLFILLCIVTDVSALDGSTHSFSVDAFDRAVNFAVEIIEKFLNFFARSLCVVLEAFELPCPR